MEPLHSTSRHALNYTDEVPLRTLIVTPTYNEKDNLEAFVGAVRAACPHADLWIVDDHSPDGTGDVADALAAKDPQIRVIHRAGKLGLGTAYLQAFALGLREGYERFVEMDADFSHDPRYLTDIAKAFDAGADVVVGSRNIRGGRVEGWGPGRHLLSKGGSLYSRMVLGINVKDLTGGFNAFTRNALERIDLSKVDSAGYSFQIEMKYRAHVRGLNIVEVPIVFVDRRAGQSKMSSGIFSEAIARVWSMRADALLGKM